MTRKKPSCLKFSRFSVTIFKESENSIFVNDAILVGIFLIIVLEIAEVSFFRDHVFRYVAMILVDSLSVFILVGLAS